MEELNTEDTVKLNAPDYPCIAMSAKIRHITYKENVEKLGVLTESGKKESKDVPETLYIPVRHEKDIVSQLTHLRSKGWSVLGHFNLDKPKQVGGILGEESRQIIIKEVSAFTNNPELLAYKKEMEAKLAAQEKNGTKNK